MIIWVMYKNKCCMSMLSQHFSSVKEKCWCSCLKQIQDEMILICLSCSTCDTSHTSHMMTCFKTIMEKTDPTQKITMWCVIVRYIMWLTSRTNEKCPLCHDISQVLNTNVDAFVKCIMWLAWSYCTTMKKCDERTRTDCLFCLYSESPFAFPMQTPSFTREMSRWFVVWSIVAHKSNWILSTRMYHIVIFCVVCLFSWWMQKKNHEKRHTDILKDQVTHIIH
jgi:hypothetical protein